MNLETLNISILGPALLAGILVLATHVPLGEQVLRRGIIFIDLALAQIAGLGVLAAHGLAWEPGGWAVQLTAALSALLAAGVFYWVEQRLPEAQEAIIGSLFVLAASTGILLLATHPLAGEHLKELLVGQILWVNPRQLAGVALLYALILALWFGLHRRIPSLLFFALLALAVTASVQLVGVYLVFASLIFPVLATYRYPTRWRLVWSYGLGLSGYVIGLVLSALLDLPSGATIVCTLGALTMLALAGRRTPKTRPAIPALK